VTAPSAHTATVRTGLRRPLATARPGLDHLRAAFIRQWEAEGSDGAGHLAGAYLQAADGTPDEDGDYAAVARWAHRRHLVSRHRAVAAN